MASLIMLILAALAIVVLAITISVYFLPAIIGFTRRHPQPGILALLNLLLGWTLIAWVALLIWALFGSSVRGLTGHLTEAERLFRRGLLTKEEYERYRQRHIDND